jgi:crotonobetainyl-CoA:carnitine CoA-transferase CaiB-like acyl-CoA transferase
VSNASALEGVKILDFTWVIAGPTATRSLADFGATVVRVESSERIDAGRTVAPFHGGEPGPDNAGIFSNMNTNKYGVTLDLATEEAREIVRDLVAWADIVCEAFSPGAMEKWGLDYAHLRAINPSLIMLSTCLFGQTGPYADIAGFGTMSAAMAGFVNLAGDPGGQPIGPFGAYTDYVAPRFTVCALLAALDHRERSGEGCYIDQSQAESAMHLMTTAVLDYAVNEHVTTGDGNRDPRRVPHGVYPARGDDEWVAIAVQSEEEWDAFCAASALAALPGDPRFDGFEQRKANEDALNSIIAAWTAGRSAQETERGLQEAGVAAHRVLNSAASYADPQLQHRGEFVELAHPIHGTTTVEGARYRLSRTPAQYRFCAPTFGRDTEFVLKEVLGYDDDQVTELIIAGALG